MSKEIKVTSSHDKAYSLRAAPVLAEAFEGDPIMTWLTHEHTVPQRKAFYPILYDCLMAACYGANSRFYEAEDFGACAALVLPGKRIDGTWNMLRAGILVMFWHLGMGGIKRALVDYEAAADRLRHEALGKEKSYYVFHIGTAHAHREKGLCSAQMRQMQVDAARTGDPIWLEATTVRSRNLYSTLGWKITGEARLGVGTVGADGLAKDGGEGVTIWGMVWRPTP